MPLDTVFFRKLEISKSLQRKHHLFFPKLGNQKNLKNSKIPVNKSPKLEESLKTKLENPEHAQEKTKLENPKKSPQHKNTPKRKTQKSENTFKQKVKTRKDP